MLSDGGDWGLKDTTLESNGGSGSSFSPGQSISNYGIQMKLINRFGKDIENGEINEDERVPDVGQSSKGNDCGPG